MTSLNPQQRERNSSEMCFLSPSCYLLLQLQSPERTRKVVTILILCLVISAGKETLECMNRRFTFKRSMAIKTVNAFSKNK